MEKQKEKAVPITTTDQVQPIRNCSDISLAQDRKEDNSFIAINRKLHKEDGVDQDGVRLLNIGYDIEIEEIRWLWGPYIPRKKLTIIQGDPGEGKTTFALALAALLTTGKPMPGCEEGTEPINVIYQTAEDGLADTIKPRLEKMGADCSRIFVIDESEKGLTLSDERIEKAILKCDAKLMILDPIQAYLGGNLDMHRANEIRPVLSRLMGVAQRTGCAIVLIGHMNKSQGNKSTYRGLGSIDIQAAARSVLIIGRSKEDKALRIMAQDKGSLACDGKSIAFRLDGEQGVIWEGFCDTTVDELLSGRASTKSKLVQAVDLLNEILDEPMESSQVYKIAQESGISIRTLKEAKKKAGIRASKKGDKWYWTK